MVINLANGPLSIYSLLSLALLFMGRLLPIILLSPFFGARTAPNSVKVALTLSLYIIFLPQLINVSSGPLIPNIWLVFLLFKELFIGFAIGIMISIPFNVVQNAGIILDHQRGGASLMVNDPTIQNQSSPFGTLFNYVLIFIFYTIGGPFSFIDAILYSYEIVPPDSVLHPNFFTKDSNFWKIQFDLFNKMMVLSIQLATPALIMILMTDVFLGIANRLAPQVQITFLGMPLKSFLAIVVVWIGWKAFVDQTVVEMYAYLNYIVDMIKTFALGVK